MKNKKFSIKNVETWCHICRFLWCCGLLWLHLAQPWRKTRKQVMNLRMGGRESGGGVETRGTVDGRGVYLVFMLICWYLLYSSLSVSTQLHPCSPLSRSPANPFGTVLVWWLDTFWPSNIPIYLPKCLYAELYLSEQKVYSLEILLWLGYLTWLTFMNLFKDNVFIKRINFVFCTKQHFS